LKQLPEGDVGAVLLIRGTYDGGVVPREYADFTEDGHSRSPFDDPVALTGIDGKGDSTRVSGNICTVDDVPNESGVDVPETFIERREFICLGVVPE
jgi:hypothetical protein